MHFIPFSKNILLGVLILLLSACGKKVTPQNTHELSMLPEYFLPDFCDMLSHKITQYGEGGNASDLIDKFRRSPYAQMDFIPNLVPPEQFAFAQPVDKRNLTVWLFNELSNNIRLPEVQYISNLLKDRALLDFGSLIDAFILFKALVEDKARFDFKHKIYERFGYHQVLDDGVNNHIISWGVTGNIHYGFLGAKIGFSETLLSMAAGFAQITDPKYENYRNICIGYLSPDRILRFGDDYMGNMNAKLGFRLFVQNEDAFTLRDLRMKIGENPEVVTAISKDIGFQPPEVKEAYLPGVPETGYGIFNGPNDKKSWPE